MYFDVFTQFVWLRFWNWFENIRTDTAVANGAEAATTTSSSAVVVFVSVVHVAAGTEYFQFHSLV